MGVHHLPGFGHGFNREGFNPPCGRFNQFAHERCPCVRRGRWDAFHAVHDGPGLGAVWQINRRGIRPPSVNSVFREQGFQLIRLHQPQGRKARPLKQYRFAPLAIHPAVVPAESFQVNAFIRAV
jgi:hypothetical protein